MGALDSRLDPQATGWRDDASESGLRKVELARAQYVAMPFRRGHFATSGNGGFAFNGAFPNNGDRTQTGLFLSGSVGQASVIRLMITGNVFGLRLDPSGGNPIGCCIDGVAYTVPGTTKRVDISNAAFTTCSEVDGVIIATDLGDGNHFVELTFEQPQSGTTRSWNVYGYIVDGKAGYTPSPPGLIPQTAAAVATSYAAITTNTSVIDGVRKAFFVNTAGTATTVSVKYKSSATQPLWSKSIAAGDSAELDFGGTVYDDVELFFQASQAGVYATLMGQT